MRWIVTDDIDCAPPLLPAMPTALIFSLVFSVALLAGLLLKLWLASRQIRHVARHRGAVPAAFTQTMPLAAHQKAADYTVAKARFGLLELAVGTALLLGWTLLGGLDALNSGLLGIMGGGMVQQLVLLLAFALIGGLLDLPGSLYQTFVIEEKFGFNKTTLKLWLADMAKGIAVGLVLGLPLAALVLWLMDAGGALWWLYAWGVIVGWQLLMMWLAPAYILPLFNKFTPLDDASLKERVASLMARAGFTAKGFFVMDGSKRSAHSNAFFTGFGSNKRVVFFDTLLSRLNGQEIEAVLAHELGHFKHHHVIKRIAMMFLVSFLGLALLGWLVNEPWFYNGLGVTEMSNHMALLLFLLVSPVFLFLLRPVMASYSRKNEFEADDYYRGQDINNVDFRRKQAYLRDQALKLFRTEGEAQFAHTFALMSNPRTVLYYLIHLASNATALSVMRDTTWLQNNLDYQFRYGVYGVGYRTLDELDENLTIYDIEDRNIEFCVNRLTDQIMEFLHQKGDLPFAQLISSTIEENPATRPLYIQAINYLQDTGELISEREGRITSSRIIRSRDIIKRANYRQLFVSDGICKINSGKKKRNATPKLEKSIVILDHDQLGFWDANSLEY